MQNKDSLIIVLNTMEWIDNKSDLQNDNPNIVSWDYVRDGAFQNIYN